jgi:benzoylsuccinyl-CoA thiolase BbsB subunit
VTGAAIVGAGMTRLGRFPERPLTDLGGAAVLAALADAGVPRQAVEAAYVGTQWGGSMIGQRVMRTVGLPALPVINVENACSSGSTALHLAVQAVTAGRHELALVLGLDKLSHQSGTLPRHAEDYEGAMGLSPPALYAMRAARYLHDTGATADDLALVTVKNRRHARDNPDALFRAAVSVAEVAAARPVATPLTLLHCCARSDGAAAVLVAGGAAARRLGRGPVRVLASDLCSGRYMPGFRDLTSPEISVRGASRAYAAAGLGPADLAFAELHDAFSIAEVIYYEALGFCPRGEGVALLKSGATAQGGRLPVNPSGGLLAKGHPPGATGIAQIVEAVRQLRGEAGPRQVEGARVGLTHCTGGGVSGLDHGACTIHILAAP